MFADTEKDFEKIVVNTSGYVDSNKFLISLWNQGKHPIKYTNNNGCNSFVRVCSHCCYNSGNHCYFSICVVRVATVHHMMHSAYMASLQ